MKKLLTPILGILILLSAVAAQAQSDSSRTRRWMKRRDFSGASLIQVTYRQSHLGQLNDILNNNKIAPLSGNDIWINLAMNHQHKNWIWEDGIGFTPQSTSETNGVKAKYNQYNAFIRWGYNVATNKSFRLFPFAGVNFSGAFLKIQDNARQNNTANFSQELLNSTSSKTFKQPNFGIDLGAGFDYLIPMKAKQMDCYTVERNIPIGFRIGYYIQTSSSDWKLDDHTLNNGPAEKQSNLFVTFNIGLGYAVKK